MSILSLEVSDFRNFHTLSFQPGPLFNWIVGDNGSGKTSLLEAIHFVATTKSFRTSVHRHYVRRDCRACLVFARSEHRLIESDGQDSDAFPLAAGVQREVSGSVTCNLNGRTLERASELAKYFPVVTLLPDSIDIIEGEPAGRRDFLDWTMFHVEHLSGQYLSVHRTYGRALSQRNQLLKDILKSASPSRRRELEAQLPVWDSSLAEWGQRLGDLREQFVAANFSQITVRDEVDPGLEASVTVDYMRGWPKGERLADALAGSRERDLDRGTTHVGPHRSDMRLMFNGVPVRDYFSRGQKKHLVARLKLRQVELFAATHHRSDVVFLGDDVFSELDRDHADSLFSTLRNLGVQVFVSTIETPEIKGFFVPEHDRMFHVEHGALVHR